jgi:hypothetical protein
MYKSLMICAAAALLSTAGSVAHAAPANMGEVMEGLTDSTIQVQRRFDRSCRRGPGGWYRYNRFGERRPCREWRGRGKRPDACVKFGPIFYCDY